MDPSLVSRLAAAGIDLDAIDGDAQSAFLALVERFGDEATLDDRFALEADVMGCAVEQLPLVGRRRAMEGFYGLRWPGFEMVGSERNDPVVIVDYDPAWPDRYLEWRNRLANALGDLAVRIEHVGSTAVPGLAAKPIVDIEISVLNIDDEPAYVPPIEAAGIALRSRDTHHRYFRPAPGRPRDVQVHVCVAEGTWERDHLLFRDYLRAHDDVRDNYARLKRELASRYPDDRVGYTEAKSEFITEVLRTAGQ